MEEWQELNHDWVLSAYKNLCVEHIYIHVNTEFPSCVTCQTSDDKMQKSLRYCNPYSEPFLLTQVQLISSSSSDVLFIERMASDGA